MPTITPQEKLRVSIGHRVRRLRQDRRWTQTQLAGPLGLSQNRLSEIELGKGSFTAEQLLTILQIFNVSLDAFAPRKKETASELQNALARLGAAHLAESADVLPTERLKDALSAIREALATADPRQIAALAPVLVNHTDNLNFAKLRADLAQVGLDRRLGWAIENTVWALAKELDGRSPDDRASRFIRAELVLETFLHHAWPEAERKAIERAEEDIFDAGIASEKTLEEVRSLSSKISRRWRIVTRIRPDDFLEALRAAYGAP